MPQKNQLLEQLKQAQEEVKYLRYEVQEKDKTLNQVTSELKRLKSEMPAVRSERERIAKQLEEAQKLENELSKLKSYQENLVELDVESFRKSMESIRERARKLAGDYFTTDLPPESLQNQNTWLIDACRFIGQNNPPRIAATNSPQAQIGRMALVLNVFAFALVQYVFTSVTTSLAGANLDLILMDIAMEDVNKEKLCRAIILSKSSRYPDEIEVVEESRQRLASLMGHLLPKEAYNAFSRKLLRILEDATKLWERSRKSKEKIFASLVYENLPTDFWIDFEWPAKKGQGTPNGDAVTNQEEPDEVWFTTFPAIALLANEKEAEPVLPGVVVRHSHIAATEKEWKTEKKTEKRQRRFSRCGAIQ